MHRIAGLQVPLLANLRNGLWYSKEFNQTCYFKSTDGHPGKWDFSLSRVNVHVKQMGEIHGALVIVDSSRTKAYPDAISRTIPIWCSVINTICKGSRDILLTPSWIKQSERTEIARRVDTWSKNNLISSSLQPSPLPKPTKSKKIPKSSYCLLEKTEDITISPDSLPESSNYTLKSPKFLRKHGNLSEKNCLPTRLVPVFVSPSSPLTLSAKRLGNLLDQLFERFEGRRRARCVPLILISASDYEGKYTKGLGWNYIRGAGDDEENWSYHLTPGQFWAHKQQILQLPSSHPPESSTWSQFLGAEKRREFLDNSEELKTSAPNSSTHLSVAWIGSGKKIGVVARSVSRAKLNFFFQENLKNNFALVFCQSVRGDSMSVGSGYIYGINPNLILDVEGCYVDKKRFNSSHWTSTLLPRALRFYERMTKEGRQVLIVGDETVPLEALGAIALTLFASDFQADNLTKKKNSEILPKNISETRRNTLKNAEKISKSTMRSLQASMQRSLPSLTLSQRLFKAVSFVFTPPHTPSPISKRDKPLSHRGFRQGFRRGSRRRRRGPRRKRVETQSFGRLEGWVGHVLAFRRFRRFRRFRGDLIKNKAQSEMLSRIWRNFVLHSADIHLP
ncbi:hypothetical protein AAMO2058_000361500 [Amorphochlora amoebiformis]